MEQKVPEIKKFYDPDNFNMANDAAKAANVDPEHGDSYTFIEKWQSHNTTEKCASGFSHADWWWVSI